MTFAVFLTKLSPTILEVAKELFETFDGDAVKAAAALKRIPDWGVLLDAKESELDARMRVLRGEKKK